jgi:hypothetical protein
MATVCNFTSSYIVLKKLNQITYATSAKSKSVQKPHPTLPDTPVALTNASKYFQTLPSPPGALQSAHRLGKSILRCM